MQQIYWKKKSIEIFAHAHVVSLTSLNSKEGLGSRIEEFYGFPHYTSNIICSKEREKNEETEKYRKKSTKFICMSKRHMIALRRGWMKPHKWRWVAEYCICMCVCVCACERERERRRGKIK